MIDISYSYRVICLYIGQHSQNPIRAGGENPAKPCAVAAGEAPGCDTRSFTSRQAACASIDQENAE
jgi:hypothetical protein